MTVYETIREILMELLDLDADSIRPDSYLVRELGTESIDFLELAVALNERFRIDVHDDTVFLRNLRLHLAQAREGGVSPLDELKQAYAFLSDERLTRIVSELDGGPVIQVRDLESYVRWQMNATQAA